MPAACVFLRGLAGAGGMPHALLLLLLALPLPSVLAGPKKYESGGFLPSPVSYYQQSGDQLAMESSGQSDSPSQNTNTATPAPNGGGPGAGATAGTAQGQGPAGRADDQQSSASTDASGRPQEPRFGFIGYSANGVQDPTYGGTAAGPYGALRLDLGGVLLGALIGLGASLVLPKLIHGIGHSHHDGYKRSEVGAEGDGEGVLSGLTHVLGRLDAALAEQNVDSTACLQRAVCSYVQSAAEAARSSSSSSSGLDTFIDSATKNSLVGYMLEGSSFKQAVDTGRKGGNCSKVYYKCPLNKDTVAAGMKSLMSIAS